MRSIIKTVLTRTGLRFVLLFLLRPRRMMVLWRSRHRRVQVTRCSFCGKTYPEIDQLIAGPGVGICDRCIRVSRDILIEEGLTPT